MSAPRKGQRFGAWLVKGRGAARRDPRQQAWTCECDCGRAVEVLASFLVPGALGCSYCARRKKAAGEEAPAPLTATVAPPPPKPPLPRLVGEELAAWVRAPFNEAAALRAGDA